MAGPWDDYGQSNNSGGEPWSEYGGQPDAPKSSGIARRLVGDTGISALKSAIAVPEAAVGIADLVTGGQAGKAAEQAGFRPKDAKAFLDDYLSPEQKAANAKLDQAEGFFDTATTALQNPSTIIHTGVESIAPMLAGGVVARGVMAAPGIAGKVAPWVAGAVGEGTIGAGMGAESIRQQTDDGLLTGEQAGLAALSGAGTAVIGAAGAKVANKLGIGEIDTLLAGGGAGQATTKGVVRKAAEGAAVEGVLQELPQSVQETALQNIALERPWDEGLGEAAAMGLLTGSALGGIAGPLGGSRLFSLIQLPKIQHLHQCRPLTLALGQFHAQLHCCQHLALPAYCLRLTPCCSQMARAMSVIRGLRVMWIASNGLCLGVLHVQVAMARVWISRPRAAIFP